MYHLMRLNSPLQAKNWQNWLYFKVFRGFRFQGCVFLEVFVQILDALARPLPILPHTLQSDSKRLRNRGGHTDIHTDRKTYTIPLYTKMYLLSILKLLTELRFT